MMLTKESLMLTDDKQPSSYARPEFDADLPQQSLLLNGEFKRPKVTK